MKRIIALSITLLLSSYAVSANALTASVSGGPAAGATLVDFGVSPFNDSAATSGTLPAGYTGGALFNTSTTGISGLAARPVSSEGNFWSVGTLSDGSIGTGSVVFDAPITYFGFLWGSPDPDPWNSVSFYNGITLLGSYNSASLTPLMGFPVSNDWGNTVYFNVFAGQGEVITSVVFTASQNAFETDNHAFITAVPEPETYGMMLAGLGLIGFMARRRMNG
ncbi:MAG TPA: FxDxF family PEP-CTERM protein [Methylophilaceae bacterium]|nr:FxDxF family PEP-CTERM protein [Methylophilaceae bacterium]